jgi:hypothetical protein
LSKWQYKNLVTLHKEIFEKKKINLENRPDIIILNKQQKQAYLLDIAVPNSHNITQTYNTKINKYLVLSVAMRNLWCLEKKFDFTTYNFNNGNSTAISF